MKQLPEELMAYHRSGARLEGDLGESEGGWYQLWPLAEVEELNRNYEVEHNAPGYLGIGSDGGGEMLALSPDGEIVIIPFIGMEPGQEIVLARSWNDFESRIRSGGAFYDASAVKPPDRS